MPDAGVVDGVASTRDALSVIRRAMRGDEAAVRALRLAAMQDSPAAFGSDLDRERARTDEDWRSWIDRGVTVLGYDDLGVGCGIVAGRVATDGGAAELLSMWVAPKSRGAGIANNLIHEVVAWAAEQDLSEVRLAVTAGNDRARRCYERHGFRLTGTETVRERDGAIELEMRLVR